MSNERVEANLCALCVGNGGTKDTSGPRAWGKQKPAGQAAGVKHWHWPSKTGGYCASLLAGAGENSKNNEKMSMLKSAFRRDLP